MEIQGHNVTRVMSKALANLAEGDLYKNWSDEFCREETNKIFKSLNDIFSKIDYGKCSKQELLNLGFGKFSDESNIMLVPLWLYNSIQDGTKLKSIFGKSVIKGKDYIDLDVRCGCIAYGIDTD